jgi:hypothetical protein
MNGCHVGVSISIRDKFSYIALGQYMTLRSTTMLLKLTASIAISSSLLAGCGGTALAEFLAEPTTPVAKSTAGTLSDESRTDTGFVRVYQTGNNDAGDARVAEYVAGRYYYPNARVSADGGPYYALGAQLDYVAFVTIPGEEVSVIALGAGNVPTTGSATYTGSANYVLGSGLRENGVRATVDANFLTGDVDVRVTGARATIEVEDLRMFGTLGSYANSVGTNGKLSGPGITTSLEMAVKGRGSFAGPNAEETAGVFDLDDGTNYAIVEVIAER